MRNVPYETHLERVKHTMHNNTEDNVINEVMGLAEDDPHLCKEAIQAYDAPEWETSYDNELNSKKQHDVWTLVPCDSVPQGQHILVSHVVFLYKQNEKKKVTRWKTCIIVKGYSQMEGIDYTDTSAPVTCLELVCTVLSVALIGRPINLM